QVLNVADARPLLKSGEVQLKYSSSAKGGLAVAAMGLVPSITLRLLGEDDFHHILRAFSHHDGGNAHSQVAFNGTFDERFRNT
ncbi:hypothetical protein, partial [Citrobacter braakii]